MLGHLLRDLRRDAMGLGPSVHLLQRQSLARLDRGGWRRMIDMLRQEVSERRVAIVMFDTFDMRFHTMCFVLKSLGVVALPISLGLSWAADSTRSQATEP